MRSFFSFLSIPYILPWAIITGGLCLGATFAPQRSVGSTTGRTSALPRGQRAPSAAPDLLADFVVSASSQRYLINGVIDPDLTLTRGHTYVFDLTAITDEHPFVINASATNPFPPLLAGPAFQQSITFTPTASMPSTIYYHCEVHYTSMMGRIDLVDPACPGDHNADLVVNVADFGLLANAYGQPCTSCRSDMNGDGMVNVNDFGLFANAFGSVCVP